MVLKNKLSKVAVASTAVATFGAAMTSMYLAPEMQADVVDITWNGGNASASAPFSAGTLNIVSQDVDQLTTSTRNFIQFNDQFNTTGRTFDPFLSTYGGGNVAGMMSVALAASGDVIDASFTGITSGALGGGSTGSGGGSFDGSGSAFIAFRETGTGNLGWFKLEYTVDGPILYGPGQYGSMGEALTVGKSGDCPFDLGDINGDGVVDLLDVTPFVSLLTTGGFECQADINDDGVVDLLDVAPFVALLSGG